MSNALDKISLCTYSTGRTMVREVLNDWLDFLGGRPNRVIFAVSPRTGAPPIYEELRGEGLIDQVLVLGAEDRTVSEIDPEAIRLAIEAAPTEWVLLVKLDTLPYRAGHETWLDDAMERVEKSRLLGMTGGFLIEDLVPLEDGYSTTQKFSNNFSIFRRSDWLRIVGISIDDGHGRSPANDIRFSGDNIRYLNEHIIEEYMQSTGQKMLVRHDAQDWSVFHVNVWGEALREVRNSYLRRRGLRRFFNTGRPLRRPLRYPWQKYYGFPRPPLVRLMRIVVGRWRRSLFGTKN